MSDQWTNEITDMDAEALLKVLERLADAAERIAENTEREEPLRPEERPPAPGTIGGIERNRYPWRDFQIDRGHTPAMVANFTEAQLDECRRFLGEAGTQEFFRRMDTAAPIPDAAFQPTPTAVPDGEL